MSNEDRHRTYTYPLGPDHRFYSQRDLFSRVLEVRRFVPRRNCPICFLSCGCRRQTR